MNMKKKLIIIYAILLVFAGCYAFINYKNGRYTRNLSEYDYFVSTARNEHYKESCNRYEVIIWNLFKMFKFNSKAQVEIEKKDVYWEQKDDYINISLNIQEDLLGNREYILSYESNPVFVRKKGENNRKSSMETRNKGQYFIGKENPDEQQFYSENSEAINELFEKAKIYFDISIDDNHSL